MTHFQENRVVVGLFAAESDVGSLLSAEHGVSRIEWRRPEFRCSLQELEV